MAAPVSARFGQKTVAELTEMNAMTSTMLSFHWNWQKLFSYAEVVCFVSAWAIGLLIAGEGQRPDTERRATRSFAAAPDSLGIQAKVIR
ncbi:MAG TPA: hypothetical protein VHK01_18010 [Lacipirellulaceae bacterium]|nr:hypothetical protein [Lacipirellulaceae bacterium]